MHPRLGGAVDHVAVIEKKTSPVRMTEILKAGNLDVASRHAGIEIIDHVAAAIEVNQVKVKLVADTVDVCDQVLVFLLATINITGVVNQPGDDRAGWNLGQDLVGSDTCGMDEVGPPMVMWLGLILFPSMERRSANTDDVFGLLRSPGSDGEDEEQE